MKKHKIAVAGLGYVGLSMAVLLSQRNTVTAVDVVAEKVNMVNRRISPLQDREIEEYLATRALDLTATVDAEAAYRDAELVVVAVPTNYDPETNYFDTSLVEQVIRQVMAVNPNAGIVIKSTIPVGYTQKTRRELGCENLFSAPNSSGRAGPFMTISIPAASSSAWMRKPVPSGKRRRFSQSFWRRVPWTPWRFSSWAPPRPRL